MLTILSQIAKTGIRTEPPPANDTVVVARVAVRFDEALEWLRLVRTILGKLPERSIRRCHPHDPSRPNWPVLEHAVVGNIVPDFPGINKSFNLSYREHHL